MSITYFLLLFLLCNFLHACNARPLRPATTDNKKFHISNQSFMQNVEKKVSVAENVESSSPGGAKEVMDVESHLIMEDNNPNLKDSKAKNTIKSSEKESHISVPWRVPHNKRGEKHPGFNLDYSPPKTHPPSHN